MTTATHCVRRTRLRLIEMALAHTLSLVIGFVAAFAVTSSARGQTCEGWLPGDPYGGVNGPVYASLVWDPDGDGPVNPKLVWGGEFTVAGRKTTSNIVAYDLVTGDWRTFGSGVSGGRVTSLAVLQSGELVAMGYFTAADNVLVNRIAKWNGSEWTPLGSGLTGGSTESFSGALQVLSNGDLVAGGSFQFAGGISSPHLARWDGETWHRWSDESVGGSVTSIAELPSGDLVVAGYFSQIGTLTVNRIARWNGTSWSAMGSGTSGTGLLVSAVTALPNGDVIATGFFSHIGGLSANGIARWSEGAWRTIGSGLPRSFGTAVITLADGSFVVSSCTNDSGEMPRSTIQRWTGTGWQILGVTAGGYARTIAQLPDTNLAIAGEFTSAGGTAALRVARSNGNSWASLEPATEGGISLAATMPNGDVVVSGEFSVIGGVPATRIALWNGSSWSALGDGLTRPARAIVGTSNGDIIVSCAGRVSNGIFVESLFRWDGQNWIPFATGPNGTVKALMIMPSGDLIAGGLFTSAGGVPASNVARWNGQSWSAFDTGLSGTVNVLALLPSGEIVAGGEFTQTGSGGTAHRLARWSPTLQRWLSVGIGVNGPVRALGMLPNGNLVVAGDFTQTTGGVTLSRIGRWNGSLWSTLGTGVSGGTTPAVTSMVVFPNGHIAVHGAFTSAGGVEANGFAKWNGSTWAPFSGNLNGNATGIALAGDDLLVAVGDFFSAGAHTSPFIARYTFSGVPRIAVQPIPQNVAAGDIVELVAYLPHGYSNVEVAWKRDGNAIENGAGGASPTGGFVTGAAATLASPTDAQPIVLTIHSAQSSDTGEFTAVFSSPCGSVVTQPVQVTVSVPSCAPCAADYDQDGGVTGGDLAAFFSDYEAGAACADVDQDGGITGGDIAAFFTDFEVGGC